MKTVGICLSGSLRSLEYTLQNIYNKLIENNKNKYKIVIFLYIPNDVHANKVNLFNKLNIEIYYEIKDDIELKLLNVNWKNFVLKIKNGKCAIQGYLQQLYGIEKSFELLKNYEKENNMKFDIICRSRTDILYMNDINIDSYDMNKITIPNFHDYYGINDRFAIGNRENMKIYMEMYSNLTKLNNFTMFYQAEIYCKYNLENNNINYIKDNNIKFNRVRFNGDISKDF
tara:strand:- start:1512 stop:2195 length:684 start_codon:yes stop_codon:yes gene_type:complete